MHTLPRSPRLYASPLRNLTPESLARQLDEFSAGIFFSAARTFDAIEQRDDVIKAVAAKRKKSPARLPWEVQTLDDSPEASRQKALLEKLFQTLTVTSATDKTLRGGLSLLIEQMMDCVGKRYACHEFQFTCLPDGSPTALLQFVPLWSFEMKNATLNFLDHEQKSHPLDPARWMVSVGDGLMEASSIAYLYKHLPLRDWLLYCERNGMPGIKGITDAPVGSPEWTAAKEAVEAFGAEFSALLSRGANIEAIDLSTRGELPYPKLVERMDQTLAALWRGADLSTLSSSNTGASLQRGESELIEEHDAANLSEVLNLQFVAAFLRQVLGPSTTLRARFVLKPTSARKHELENFRLLKELGLPLPAQTIYSRLGLVMPQNAPETALAPEETTEEKD